MGRMLLSPLGDSPMRPVAMGVSSVPTVTPTIEHAGDYYWVEIKDDSGRTLIRVGFDHEPTQDEIDALIQQLLTQPSPPPEEVLLQWQP